MVLFKQFVTALLVAVKQSNENLASRNRSYINSFFEGDNKPEFDLNKAIPKKVNFILPGTENAISSSLANDESRLRL